MDESDDALTAFWEAVAALMGVVMVIVVIAYALGEMQ